MRGSWRDGIRMAGELGYDGVELAVRDPLEIDSKTAMRVLHDARLEVSALGTGQAYLKDGLSLTHDDKGMRTRAIERLEAHIRLAGQLGTKVIVGLLRGRIVRDRSTTDARLEDALRRPLELADLMNVPILLEAINRYETDYLPRIEDVLEVVERLGSPVLGVLADTFHMNIEETSLAAALRRAGSRLRHVHVADSNRLAPGWGHVDFSIVVQTLQEMDYDGFLSAEILPRPDPISAARQAVACLRPLMQASS